MRREPRRNLRESGQAVLEYLLLLVIIVIIALSLLYQFSSAFRVYADAFFGGYIACLLETGELPGDSATCSPEFKSFNLKDGKKLLSGNLPNDGGGSGGGDSGTGKKDEKGPTQNTGGRSDGRGGNKGQQAAKDGPKAAEETVGSGSSDGGGGEGSASVGTVGKFDRPKKEAAAVPIRGSASATVGERSESLLGVSPTSSDNYVFDGGKKRGVTSMDWGYGGEEEEKDKQVMRPPIAPMTRNSSDETALRPKSAVENTDRKPTSEAKEDSGGFSFGGFIRLLLIIAIIVAIIVFFGGQIMQATKSWDK